VDPEDLCEVVYIDHFGNAMTGLRALMLPCAARLVAVGGARRQKQTFNDV
jgi:S-adenosylmethionine hydrolase